MSVNFNNPLGGWFNPTGGYTPQQPYTQGGVPMYALRGGDPQATASGSSGDFDWDAALAALAAQNQFNQQIAQGGLNNQQQQTANQHQYQMALIQQAKDQLAQAARQFEQTYGLQVGSLTGMFNGQPTLQNLGQQAQYTGFYNGTPTLQNIGQQQQFGLNQGALTGWYGGQMTLPALQNQQNQALAWAQMLGQTPGGDPTLAAQLGLGQLGVQQGQLGLQQAGVTGTYNGQQTQQAQQQAFNQWLAQQQLANGQQNQQAQLGLQTLQLGAGLGGPSDWLNYESAAAGARQNPLLAQGVASWADMTQGGPRGGGGWGGGALQPRTVGTLAADFGAGQAPQMTTGGNQADLAAQWQAQYGQGAGAGGVAEPMRPTYGGNQGMPQHGNGFGFSEGPGQGASGGPNARATADYMAHVGQNTNQWAPGFWGSLNPDQQDMYKNAWSRSGQSPTTVLSNASRNAIGQGFGNRAA